MDRAEIETRVLSIVHEQKTIEEDALTPETRLDAIGIDSLDALNILFAIEETFGITVPDEEARDLRTVSAMVDVIESHLSESA